MYKLKKFPIIVFWKHPKRYNNTKFQENNLFRILWLWGFGYFSPNHPSIILPKSHKCILYIFSYYTYYHFVLWLTYLWLGEPYKFSRVQFIYNNDNTVWYYNIPNIIVVVLIAIATIALIAIYDHDLLLKLYERDMKLLYR